MKIITNLSHDSNYGIIRNSSNIKYIVIHSSLDDFGENVDFNYFNTKNLGISFHRIIDEDICNISVQDNYIAKSINTKNSTKVLRNINNSNSISILLCSNSKTTYETAYKIIADIMYDYKISPINIYRHYDINKELCPCELVDPDDWREFKDNIKMVYKDKYGNF